jgi:hypothetical protein
VKKKILGTLEEHLKIDVKNILTVSKNKTDLIYSKHNIRGHGINIKENAMKILKI